MNNETKTNNRGWIKNAAIIFLAVMLLLTFFSNTILNWSLPEVSGKYAGYGQIKTSITGSGTVSANMNYNITLEEPRTIERVLVKVGDVVVPDQPLFILEEYENEELINAEKSLEEMEFNYQMKLLNRDDAASEEASETLAELRENLEELKKDKVESQKSSELVKGSEELLKIYQNEKDKYTQSVAELQEKVTQLTNGEAANSEEIAVKLEQLETAKKNLEAAEEIFAEKKEIYDEKAADIDLSYDAALAAYESAKKSYDSAYAELTYLQQDYNDLLSGSSSYESAKKKFDSASSALDKRKNEETEAKAILEAAKSAAQEAYTGNIDSDSEYNTLLAEKEAALLAYIEAVAGGDAAAIEEAKAALDAAEKVVTALDEYRSAKDAVKLAENNVAAAQKEYDKAKSELESIGNVSDSELSTAKRAIERKRSEVSELGRAVSTARTKLNEATTDDEILKKAEMEKDTAEKSVKEYKKENDRIQKELDNMLSGETKKARADLKSENEKLKAVTSKYDDENKKLTELREDVSKTPEQIDEEIKTLEKQIKSAEKDAEKQQVQDSKDSIKFNLEVQRDLAAIEEQRAKIEKLKEKTYATEVKSKHDGTIAAINAYAGGKVTPGETLAEVEVAGKGYGLQITVTTEQSRQIKVGDKVTVDGYWWGEQLDLKVAAIKTDRNDPNNKKIVEIDIDGPVNNGQTLNVSIGERQTSYDLVVPNSAIREDADGKYILVASVKSTPLGNRYKAKRINVTVIAKDSINSAVDAGTEYGNEYVISSATAPISDGSLVRLVES